MSRKCICPNLNHAFPSVTVDFSKMRRVCIYKIRTMFCDTRQVNLGTNLTNQLNLYVNTRKDNKTKTFQNQNCFSLYKSLHILQQKHEKIIKLFNSSFINIWII